MTPNRRKNPFKAHFCAKAGHFCQTLACDIIAGLFGIGYVALAYYLTKP